MPDKEFKLPHSSFNELKKLLIAFAKSKNPSSLDDLTKLTGIHKTLISSNNGFFESIGVITGGNKKEATETGKKLGLALANNMEAVASQQLRALLTQIEFIESMITALGIKPRSKEDFQAHIAYSLGKEHKGRNATGCATLVELFQIAEMVEENEGLLQPRDSEAVNQESTESLKPKAKPEPQKQSEQLGTSFTKRITNEIGNNVTLNINIQLTIPETENEKVYENFFQAMKKHLLS